MKKEIQRERHLPAGICEVVRENHGNKFAGRSRDDSTKMAKFLKKVAERSRDSGRRSRDGRMTVKQRFLDVSSDSEEFWKKSLNGHATVVGGHATVGLLSNNVLRRFKQFGIFFFKVTEGHATVVGGHATVGWLSNNVFLTFQAILKIFLKKVAERSRDSGRRSRDRRMTVKQRFSDVSSDSENFWKKSLNGHATVVGGHATVGLLSNNVSRRFRQFGFFFKVTEGHATVVGGNATVQWLSNNVFFDVSSNSKFFWKKSLNGHATVVGGHATVGLLSNNVFRRFKQFGKILKKVTEGHATVVGGHATVVWLSNNVFLTLQAIRNIFEKVTERSRDSGQRSRDRRPTVKQRFLDVSSDLEIFWKKSLNGHATVVGGHATVGRLSNNVFWTFQAIWNFSKKVTERSRDSGRRSRDRRPTVKQRFLYVSSNLKFFWKKSLNGHATVVGGHATVGRLSNNVFWMFQAIWNFFEKSHWTVTRQWSEVTRPSADCQTTFFVRFKQFEFFLKKVTERSRDSGRRSRDRRPTVKQRFLDVSSNLKFFWKKSLNGHATVVGGHATVGWLSSTYMHE